VRAAVSVSPASLKENRQGSVMLRGQHLWEGGSLSVLFSPGLARQPEPEGLNPDLGATNRQHRGLLTLSQKVAGFTPATGVTRRKAGPPSSASTSPASSPMPPWPTWRVPPDAAPRN
jgi:hypothetical protein